MGTQILSVFFFLSKPHYWSHHNTATREPPESSFPTEGSRHSARGVGACPVGCDRPCDQGVADLVLRMEGRRPKDRIDDCVRSFGRYLMSSPRRHISRFLPVVSQDVIVSPLVLLVLTLPVPTAWILVHGAIDDRYHHLEQ